MADPERQSTCKGMAQASFSPAMRAHLRRRSRTRRDNTYPAGPTAMPRFCKCALSRELSVPVLTTPQNPGKLHLKLQTA